jgi:hypothetical protein
VHQERQCDGDAGDTVGRGRNRSVIFFSFSPCSPQADCFRAQVKWTPVRGSSRTLTTLNNAKNGSASPSLPSPLPPLTSLHTPHLSSSSYPPHRVNSYVRILGTLKTFSNKRHINVTRLRKIDDFNEVLFHPLECVYVHKYYVDGPVRRFPILVLLLWVNKADNPLTFSSFLPFFLLRTLLFTPLQQPGGTSMNAINSTTYDSGANPYAGDGGGAAGGAGGGGGDLYSDLPGAQRQIMQWVQQQTSSGDAGEEGVNVNAIVRGVGGNAGKVKEEVENLINDGHLYQTIDDDQYAHFSLPPSRFPDNELTFPPP